MRFTLNITMLDPAQYIPLAQAAEKAGFYAASVSDSIFYPQDVIGKYPYHEGREFLENKPFIEPFVAISAMATATNNLHFSTYVLKMAIREPLVTAKSIFSTAVMSNNRFTLGVGLSPWRDDFLYCQIPWAGRGKRLDETIKILRGLESGEYFEFKGEHFTFNKLKMCPVPSQRIPITVGGHTKPALERAAQLADGWVAANLTRAQMKGLIAQLNQYRKEYGSDNNQDYIIQGMLSDVEMFSPAGYKEAEEMGMTDVTVAPWGAYVMENLDLQQRLDYIKRFGDEVISQF